MNTIEQLRIGDFGQEIAPELYKNEDFDLGILISGSQLPHETNYKWLGKFFGGGEHNDDNAVNQALEEVKGIRSLKSGETLEMGPAIPVVHFGGPSLVTDISTTYRIKDGRGRVVESGEVTTTIMGDVVNGVNTAYQKSKKK